MLVPVFRRPCATVEETRAGDAEWTPPFIGAHDQGNKIYRIHFIGSCPLIWVLARHVHPWRAARDVSSRMILLRPHLESTNFQTASVPVTGRKREQGIIAPSIDGALETLAAPATVSGERVSILWPLGNREGRTRAATREPGDLPSSVSSNRCPG